MVGNRGMGNRGKGMNGGGQRIVTGKEGRQRGGWGEGEVCVGWGAGTWDGVSDGGELRLCRGLRQGTEVRINTSPTDEK